MAMRIQADRVVSLVYRMTDTEGRVLDEMTPATPYEYIQGRGQILPALERVLEGKTPGFSGELQLSPRDAYGEFVPALVAEIPRERFPADAELAPGMKFNTTGPSGQSLVVRVIEVDDKNVTLDGNHPLAGMDLIFEVRVIDVRDATEDEKESGQVSAKRGLEFSAMETEARPFTNKTSGGKGPGSGSGQLH